MSDASGGSSAQSSSKAPPSGAGVPGVSVPILTTSSASLSTSSTLATPVTGAAPASPIPSLLLHSIDGAGVTASPLSPKGTGTLRPKQRERLIKVISGETVEEGLGATNAIQHVLDIVKQQRIGRVGWFHDGILPALAAYICRNGHEHDSSLAYELCEVFIHDEFGMSEGVSALADIITGHMKDHVQCSGMSRALVHFIRNAIFRSAFIKRGGVAKLLKIYEQASKLGPRQLRPASTTMTDGAPPIASQAAVVATREIRQMASSSPVRQRREEIQSLMRAAGAPSAASATSGKSKRHSGQFSSSPVAAASLSTSVDGMATATAAAVSPHGADKSSGDDASSLSHSGQIRTGLLRHSNDERSSLVSDSAGGPPISRLQLALPLPTRSKSDGGELSPPSSISGQSSKVTSPKLSSTNGGSSQSDDDDESASSSSSSSGSSSSGASPAEQDDNSAATGKRGGAVTARRVQIVSPLSQLASSAKPDDVSQQGAVARKQRMRKSMPAPVSRKQLLPALNLLALGGGGGGAGGGANALSPGAEDGARMVMSPKGSIGIPKLQLGVIQVAPSGDKGAVVAASHGTRSSRRMSHRGAFSPALPALLAAAGAQSRTAAQEMKSLAFKLGETYCTQDLTVLLQYKKRVLGSPVFTKHKEEENVVDAEEQIMRGTAYYRCKVDLLRVLDFIASDRRELSSIPSPINLLFQELATTYEHGVSIDDAKNALVFSVLGHLAQFNEHCAINAVPPPPAVTAGMPKEFVDVLSDDAKRGGAPGAAAAADLAVSASTPLAAVFSPRVATFLLPESHEDEATVAANAAAAAAVAATRDSDDDVHASTAIAAAATAAAAAAAPAAPLQTSTRGIAPTPSNNEHNVTEFLLMINNRLKVYLSTLLVDDLNVPLSVLADYMNKCRTRVLASRVVTVCLSSLLRVKQTIFSEALKVDSFRLVRTVHYLLMVFDEIAMQNSSSTLNTLLLSVLFEGTKNATFLQEYATQLLINEQFASKTLARRNGAWLLSQYRQRVIEHFRTLVAMVEREQELVLASVDSVGLGVTTTSVRAKRLDNRRTELLGKLLEPLVLPHVGIAAQFMQQCPPHRFYAEHVAMLHFLADLFAARCSPFVFEQSIIDAYVQHHYLEFVKLYTTAGLDSRSLTLVRLHLRVLLSFAKHKTSECAQKFYQLRVMDFLVREVASEFTITTSFVRGRGRADSVVAAPVVTEFLKQVQAAAASRAAATPSPTHGGDPLSARTAGSSRKTTRPKKASGGAASLSTASAAAAGKSDTLTDASAVDPTSTADESGNPADDDDAADLLLSPKSRARRRGRKTPRKGGVQPTPSSPDGGSSGGGSATQGDGLGAVAAAAASVAATAAAAAPTSVSSGTLPVVAPPGDADVIAALEAQIPPAPPKPEPLPQKPTVEQYKKFMIERYEYEQWENQASLVRRRIEHVRQMMAKDSWMDDSGAGPNSALPRSAMSPRDSPRASPRVMGSPRSPALRSPGRERRHRVDDTGGTGSQAGSDSEQIDRLQRHSSLPHSVGTSSAGGAAAAPALPFQLRIVPASNDSKGGAQPHRRNLTVTPAVTQAQPLVVGRGPSSGIHEKRLSRAHMEIFTQTTAGRATLVVRAIGGNPSFVKSRGTSSLRPLPQKQPYVVEDGDVVYLLDDQYAYEVVEPQYPSSSSDTEQPPQQPPQVQPLQLQQAAVKLQHRGTSSSSPMTVGVAVRRDSIKTFSEDSRPPLTTLSDTSEPEALDNGSHSPALAMRQNSSPLLQRPHVPTLRLERPGSTGEGEGAGATTPSLKKRIGSLFKGKRSGTSSGVHVKALDADIAAAAAIADASTADTAATLPDAGSSLAAAVVVPSTPNADDSLTSSKAGIEDSGADDAADDAQSSAAGGDDASATVHKKKRNRAKSHIHSVPRTKLATTAAAASAIVAAASTSPAPAAASPVATVSGTPPKPGGIAMMKPMLKLNIGSLGMSGLTGGSSEPIKPAAEVVAPPAAAATTTPNKATPGKLKLNLGSLGLTTSTSEPVIGNVPDAGGATTASEPAGKLFALKASTASPLAAAAALAQRSDERLVRYAPPQAPAVLNDDEAKRTYAQDRENHKLYHDTDLHALMLQLIFSMLTTANETLDPLYTAQYPLVQKKLNIPFILHQHINWPENRTILPRLQRGLLEHGTSAYRLFKLLCVNAFNPTAYANLERVATGAYGVVYFSQLVETPRDDDDDEDYGDAAGGGAEDDLRRKPRVTSVAVKLMDVPHSVHDRCVLHDIFTEILILEHFRADPDSCRLFDFGLDHEHYWITMKRYCGSLKEWRNRQRKPLEANLLLYMNIYEKVLRTIYKLHGHRIIHFDIKCDNFFIEPHTSGATLDEVVDQPTSEPNFSVALGDFGESMVFQDESDAYTTQNRGTECIRSPEMLAVANSRNVAHYDRRRRQGATTSSDMWSLGCAFYELCTTEFLFYDGDWGAFFARVTSTSIPLISQQRKDLVNNDQVVLDFLEYVFIRDPLRRPTIEDVIKRFGTMKRKVQRRADEGGASGDPSLWGMIGGEDERPLEREPRITRNLYEQQRHRDQLTQITDSLFISNAAAAHRRGELSGERGITHIIHVTVDRERKHGAGTATLVRTAPLQLSSGSGGGGGSGGTVATPGAGRSATLGRNTIATSVSARVPSKARPGSVTGGAANSSGQFVQLNVVLPVKPVGDEILPPAMLTRLYEFARRGSVIGKVLVYSDGSMQGAASVACALVMAEHECCFEASLQLLERRRPGCRPSAAHAAALDSYGDRCGFDGLVAFSVPDYRCLCGAATVTLRRKLHTLGVEPRPCRCAAGGKAGGGADAREQQCPSGGCAKHLVDLSELYGYNADYLKWASTTTDNVARTTFAHTTEIVQEWSPAAAKPATEASSVRGMLVSSASGPLPTLGGGSAAAGAATTAAAAAATAATAVGSGGASSTAAPASDELAWRTYRCRMCKFMTHAVSNRGQLELVIQYRGMNSASM